MKFKCAMIVVLFCIQAAQSKYSENLDIFDLIYPQEIPELNDVNSVLIEDGKLVYLYQEIVEKFDKIDGELEEILKPVRNALYDPPVKNRTKCTVSQDELVKLRDQIKDIMNNVSSSEGKCDFFSRETEDNCNSWLKLIQCGVKELGDGFRNATSGSASLEEITKWKHAYDNLLQQYQKDIDNVKASLSQEFEKKIEELTSELQRLSELIAKTQEELKKTYLKLCVSEISNGRSAEAVGIFKQLKDVSLLDEIVKTAYNDYGKRSNVNHIVDFVKKLPHCNQDRAAYPVLFSLMKESSALVKPEVVTLYEAVQKCMCQSDLKKELQKYAS